MGDRRHMRASLDDLDLPMPHLLARHPVPDDVPDRAALSPARRMLPVVAVALFVAGCAASISSSSEAASMTDSISVTSPAFGEDETIPGKYTCDGDDVSPPLEWSGSPNDAAAFALLVDDPDARGFVHWAVADIPGDRTSLGEGEAAGVQGRNGFGRDGYGGPCPPSGSHRYVFTVFALSQPLDLAPGFSADELRAAMEGVAVGSGQLAAHYGRGE